MGKSIVHCAECGKAIREDDYAKGQASIIDSKNYCSTCRPVMSSASKTLDFRKSSTSRMPLASGQTPRRGTPVISDKSRMPLIAGGAAVAVGLIAIILFALSGKKPPEPVEQPAPPKTVKPAVAKVVEVPKPPVEVPPAEQKPPAAPEVAKPAVAEKTAPPVTIPPEATPPAPAKPEAEPAPAALVEPPAPTPAPVEPMKAEPAPAGKSPEPKKEIAPQVDQKKVDAAIKKGVQYLVGQIGKTGQAFDKEPTRTCHMDELVLWTFIHAGVSESTTPFRYLFKNVTEAEFRRTYEVSLQAMILEELDRVRYQQRMLQCAQFLADNQCKNGQWNYGESPTKDVATVYGALPVPTASRPGANPTGARQKPAVVKKLKVRPLRSGPAEGDNSNSQYAALGIRACADAGIEFPEDLLTRARKWFRESQHDAEGGAGGVATGTGISAPPKGWCYMNKWHGHNAYGSMTAGAIGGIAIYDTLLGEDWRNDPAVASGLSWLARNFSVTGNPGPPSEEWAKGDTKWCHYYYLYALERAGVLCRTEWMGRHAWYPEGANFLVAAQGRDGAWNESVSDTCFAILFLKRATRPLEDVASMDERTRK